MSVNARSQSKPVTLDELNERFEHAIVVSVGDDGYPLSVAAGFRADEGRGAIELDDIEPAPPTDREVAVVFSHIRPQPGQGYDERRYVQFWGTLRPSTGTGRGGYTFTPASSQGWDEEDVPFFEFSERNVPQALAYMDRLSEETGKPVRPKLSKGWLFLRATRLPFLSATVIPVGLGIAIAGNDGAFDWWFALLTLIGASCVQLGLNVANDVFDTMSGADDANVTPTQFSGGSRVIQYGLVSLRQMATLSTVFYALAGVIGLILLATHGSTALLVIGVVGFIVSLGYTAPPLKFVYRGLGEIAVALGFGPLMLLGAYVVQTGGALAWEPFVASIPVALLVALILYVNEIPDRRSDARAGKRTLPVRFSPTTIITGYNVAVAAAMVVLVAGVLFGVLPIPVLAMLVTIPLALRVSRGLRPNYDNPYGLMAIMGANVQLHLRAGLLLLAAYVVVLVVGAVAPAVDLFLR